MAGIWDRITPGDDRLSVHLVTSALHLAGLGVFTPSQILNALNATLETPLDQAATSDLSAMVSDLGAADSAGKAQYILTVESLHVAAEAGLLASEQIYRTVLGLS